MPNATSLSAHNILYAEHAPLDAIFKPKSVAVVGATERHGSLGKTLLWNLMTSSFGGPIFPINPNRPSVLGIKAYSSIKALPDPVDLAVICTPAITVPQIIRECVEAGVRGAIVISAGFKEVGDAGVRLEAEILAEARKGQMRIIGPNCLGVMNPITGLNATFASAMARPGNVGFISQSGALCTAVLDWSLQENVGFSAFVSIGSMLDVDWGDLIYYLGSDERTKSIVMYMETIGNARSFLSAAREVALTKPIIVIKPGITAEAAHAAASHTGSLTGSDEVLGAAFRRSGVLRVSAIDDLFSVAEVLAKQPLPNGPRLTILTNAGGPGVLATDALIFNGGELAQMSEETTKALNELLPDHWSHSNPIDILGDADPKRYAEAIKIAAREKDSDGLMVILTPQAMTDPTQTAQEVKKAWEESCSEVQGKPILASWMGGVGVALGEQILNQSTIPTFPFPDTAARVFNYMWNYRKSLETLYETPSIIATGADVDREAAEAIIASARAAGKTLLSEYESKNLLSAFGIPTTKTVLADSEDAAIAACEQFGYPVVIKLHSDTITHKTDVGGVKLGLKSPEEVRLAFADIAKTVAEKVGAQHFQGVTVQPMVALKDSYELILGSSPDPQFGPVVLFGTGGTLVEVFKDRSLGIPPLTATLARRVMERTKIYQALKGVRGRKAVDFEQLESLIVRFSQLVVEHRWIKEIDINPLLASAEGILALDARVVLYDKDTDLDQIPPLAIRPYPQQYVSQFVARNDMEFVIRPIMPEDEPKIVYFHKSLSEESFYLRYFRRLNLSQRVTHERLTRICFTDYDRTIALVAETTDKRIAAVGRLNKIPGSKSAAFGMLVNDNYQGQGLGVELLSRLLVIAKAEGLETVEAYMLDHNQVMQRMCERFCFSFEHKDDFVKVVKIL